MMASNYRAPPLVVALSVLSACSGPQRHATPPRFAAAPDAVFQPAVPIVKTTVDALYPTVVADSDLVVYAAKVDGNLDLIARPIQGGAALRLTSHSADDTEPEFSPDGRQIAWSSQADDVKGDIWIMDVDGSNKRRLTDRTTTDRAPIFSPDGTRIYFCCRAPGALYERIEVMALDGSGRRTLVDVGRDPAISPDGRMLAYVAPDEHGRSRLYAKQLETGLVAAVTDGVYLEGLPRMAHGLYGATLLFTRWVDDFTGDGVSDGDDPASLWSVELNEALFDGAPPATPRPLTPGEGGELFVSVVGDWMVFTAGGGSDLEIHALPVDGMIRSAAGAEAILAAARAQENPTLKRLALRYIVATSPIQSASARYELARDQAERGRLVDAIEELQRVIADADNPDLVGLAEVEVQRLQMLQGLRGVLVAREDAQRQAVASRADAVKAIAARYPMAAAVQFRARLTRAEADAAVGRRSQAVAALEELGRLTDLPAEDGARALDRLGEFYALLYDDVAVARVAEACARRFPKERYYVVRGVDRWIEIARRGEGLSSLAALEEIAHRHNDLTTVAARAAVALAKLQEQAGHESSALAEWQRIATEFEADRDVLAEALVTLGEAHERQSEPAQALATFERLMTEFPERAGLRARAQRGHTRIAFAKARAEEALEEFAAARDSYQRLLSADREMIQAHRRYISLSARLGRLEEVLSFYRAEAEANPRDRISRYGYGYALTFVTPPPLAEAEHELVAALALDPKFAAAHLTLGWVREQRERQDSRGGWLEQAVTSYQTTIGLVDELSEPELYGAAQLNVGNALGALGKNDDAFAAYLTRELLALPFEDVRTELLFRENFARIAMRMGEYDVALDMARLGVALSNRLDHHPRLGTLASLIGAVGLATGADAEAVEWFDRAAGLHAQAYDWVRLIPALRGKALALRALGRYDESLALIREILKMLAQDRGPGDLRQCWQSGTFQQEIPANPKNVTRAVCGFSAAQEEEIALATAERVLAQRGYSTAARDYDLRRLALWRAAASDKRLGPRVRVEWMLALAEAARLAALRGEPEAATGWWLEAAEIATSEGRSADLATLAHALVSLWSASPDASEQEHWAVLRALLERGLGDKPEPAVAGVMVRAVTLLDALAVVARAAPGKDPLVQLKARLGHLESGFERLLADADQLRALKNPDHRTTAMLAHLDSWSGRPQSSSVDDRAAALRSAPLDWRWRFERSLWDMGDATSVVDPAWLQAAIEAFESSPHPVDAPERGLFLSHAATWLLAQNQAERAWRLLERDRLLGLQPRVERIPARLRARVAELTNVRSDAARYASLLKSSPALVRALLAEPAELASVQAALETDATFLQVFQPVPSQLWWFAVDAKGLKVAVTKPMHELAIPAEVRKELLPTSDSTVTTLYVDPGETTQEPSWTWSLADRRLIDLWEVVESLSATYLIAARDARRLGGQDVVWFGRDPGLTQLTVLGGGQVTRTALGTVGSAARMLVMDMPEEVAPAGRNAPGHMQISWPGDEGASDAERLDLDTLAQAPLSAVWVSLNRVSSAPRPARAVAQALLLAGVPSVVVGSGDTAQRFASAMAANDTSARPATLVANAMHDEGALPMRFIGHRGLNATERVDFALDNLMRMAGVAKKSFDAAKSRQDTAGWEDAKRAFTDVVETLGFLRRPEVAVLLAQSSHKLAKAVAPTLKSNEIANRKILTSIQVKLGEVDDAAAILELLIESAAAEGNTKGVAELDRDLGVTFYGGKRYPEAAERLKACAGLAQTLGESLLKAECLTQGALAERARYDYPAAVRAYHEAILIYAAKDPAKQIKARRDLGFLYADALNNYDKALEQFEAALGVARAHKLDDMVVALMLDCARVFRARGEYELALNRAQEAEGLAAPSDHRARANIALETAKLYWYRGNYRRALERQRQALELARKINDDFLEIQAISLGGLVALNQGELERAERSITAALDLSRMSGRKAEEATQLNNLGIVLRQAGRIDEAVERFSEALALDEKLGSIEGRAFDLRNLALAFNRKGAYQEALVRVTEALTLSRSIGLQYNEVQCLLARGDALSGLADPGSVEMYTAAAQLAKRTSVAEVEWRALYALGRHAEAAGDVVGARHWLSRALAVAERLGRGQADSSDENNRDDLFADAIRLSAQAGDLASTHQLMERARGRAMLDVLSTRTLELPTARAKALLEADTKAQDAVTVAGRDEAEGALGRLNEARAVRAQSLEALRAEYPRLAHTFTIEPLPLSEVQQHLPEDVVVLSYFVGREASSVLLVRRASAKVVTLNAGYEELAHRLESLGRDMRAFGNVDDNLQSLAAMLLVPLAADLQDARTLLILPHGLLHAVPWVALPVNGKPALENWLVAVYPNANLMTELLQHPRRPKWERLAALSPATDLPFAHLEALAVAGDKALRGAAATKQAFKSLMVDALDLPAHTRLEPRDPLASAITLGRQGDTDDTLELAEVFALAHVPAVVTLSGCETEARSGSGQDWIGLGTAFLTAGSDSVVASQQRVSDLASALLMKRFYRNLKNESVGESLRQAMLLVRHYFPHPAHWSSFVLIGDHR